VDEILRYMQDYMQMETISYNTKVLVVGNSGCGKTALVNSLLKKGKKSADNCSTTPTNGINIR
jgi:GTPase SAR1 family protein